MADIPDKLFDNMEKMGYELIDFTLDQAEIVRNKPHCHPECSIDYEALNETDNAIDIIIDHLDNISREFMALSKALKEMRSKNKNEEWRDIYNTIEKILPNSIGGTSINNNVSSAVKQSLSADREKFLTELEDWLKNPVDIFSLDD